MAGYNFNQDGNRRIRQVVKDVERGRFPFGFVDGTTNGGGQVPNGYNDLIPAVITEEVCDGLYKAIEIGWVNGNSPEAEHFSWKHRDNVKQFNDDEPTPDSYPGQHAGLVMEVNLRENIPVGTLIFVQYGNQLDDIDNDSEITRKHQWMFKWDGNEGDFMANCIWDEDGFRHFLINAGCVQIGNIETIVAEKEVQVDNTEGCESPSLEGSETDVPTWYFVEVIFTYDTDCGQWVPEINDELQEIEDAEQPDKWEVIKPSGMPDLPGPNSNCPEAPYQIIWRLIVGDVFNGDWKQHYCGAMQYPNFPDLQGSGSPTSPSPGSASPIEPCDGFDGNDIDKYVTKIKIINIGGILYLAYDLVTKTRVYENGRLCNILSATQQIVVAEWCCPSPSPSPSPTSDSPSPTSDSPSPTPDTWQLMRCDGEGLLIDIDQNDLPGAMVGDVYKITYQGVERCWEITGPGSAVPDPAVVGDNFDSCEECESSDSPSPSPSPISNNVWQMVRCKDNLFDIFDMGSESPVIGEVYKMNSVTYPDLDCWEVDGPLPPQIAEEAQNISAPYLDCESCESTSPSPSPSPVSIEFELCEPSLSPSPSPSPSGSPTPSGSPSPSDAAAFISQWKTDNTGSVTSANNQIKLPLIASGNYNFDVDWGDGNQDTITAYNDPAATHTYSVIGTYTVTITGTIEGWRFDFSGNDNDKIIDVIQCGPLTLTTDRAFVNCANLAWSATDPLLLDPSTTSLEYCFRFANVNNAGINFNPNVSGWDTSNVTNFSQVFYECKSFDRDLSGWNVSNGQTFSGFLFNASSFSLPLFSNVSSSCLSLNSFISGASNYTGIDNNMSTWDVSGCTDMNFFAQFASNFNSDIESWNPAALTSMSFSFQFATALNRDLGGWTIPNLLSVDSMYDGCSSMSNANYSNLLVGWQPQIATNGNPINASFQCPAQYEAYAAAARTDLINNRGWSITDGGPA